MSYNTMDSMIDQYINFMFIAIYFQLEKRKKEEKIAAL